MGLRDLLGGLVGAVPGGSAVKAAVGVLSKFVETPEDKQALAEIGDRAAARESDERKGQMAVNKIEAAHRTVFVAGWRPAIGWGLGSVLVVCGWAIGIRWIAGMFVHDLPPMPDPAPLVPFFGVITSMLGINAMLRSRDKRLGTSK